MGYIRYENELLIIYLQITATSFMVSGMLHKYSPGVYSYSVQVDLHIV